MTRRRKQTPQRLDKVLARPIVQAGVLREPGETITLTPAQVERLAPEGYFADTSKTENNHDDKLQT